MCILIHALDIFASQASIIYFRCYSRQMLLHAGRRVAQCSSINRGNVETSGKSFLSFFFVQTLHVKNWFYRHLDMWVDFIVTWINFRSLKAKIILVNVQYKRVPFQFFKNILTPNLLKKILALILGFLYTYIIAIILNQYCSIMVNTFYMYVCMFCIIICDNLWYRNVCVWQKFKYNFTNK